MNDFQWSVYNFIKHIKFKNEPRIKIKEPGLSFDNKIERLIWNNGDTYVIQTIDDKMGLLYLKRNSDENEISQRVDLQIKNYSSHIELLQYADENILNNPEYSFPYYRARVTRNYKARNRYNDGTLFKIIERVI